MNKSSNNSILMAGNHKAIKTKNTVLDKAYAINRRKL